jgi:protoporphyrinogen/coproporphyrinogen III oxidase
MEDVIVIGGGIAGLTAAYRLLRAGKRVRCFEANGTAGGCVRTDRTQGYLCERGAQNFLEEDTGPLHRLARDLGIAERIRPARDTRNYVAWDGRLLTLPRQLPRLLSVKGLCRALLETTLPRGNEAAEESVAVWARRRFGRVVAQRVIDPMIGGVYAGDPERLSAPAAIDLGTQLEQRHRSVILGIAKERPVKRNVSSFVDGMGTLTHTLARALGEALFTATEVQHLEATGDGAYRVFAKDVKTRAGSGALQAKQVVVATPAPLAALLAVRLDSGLADLLASIPYAPLASLWLSFAPDAFRAAPPAGYGMVRPHCQGDRNLGCIFCSSAFEGAAPPDRLLWRVLFGGRRDPTAADLSAAELTRLALRELGPVLGLTPRAHPEFVHLVKHAPGLPQYEIGHLKRVEEIRTRLQRLSGLHLSGNAYHGVPVGKVIEQANATAARLLERERSC